MFLLLFKEEQLSFTLKCVYCSHQNPTDETIDLFSFLIQVHIFMVETLVYFPCFKYCLLLNLVFPILYLRIFHHNLLLFVCHICQIPFFLIILFFTWFSKGIIYISLASIVITLSSILCEFWIFLVDITTWSSWK